MEGVLLVGPDDTDGEGMGAEGCVEPTVDWEMVLCCFCGELVAEGETFWGEFMEGGGCGFDEGLVTDAGALEYNVTAGVDVTPLEEGKCTKGC